jgi:purine-binding chemotaxis protein CheW
MANAVKTLAKYKKVHLQSDADSLEGKGLEYVVFALGAEKFAVGIESIQEILKPQNVTEIPHTPDFLVGVINLRGKIVPVVDLRQRLGMSAKEVGKSSRIIVAIHQSQAIGMLVDSVLAVQPVATKRIERASPLISGAVDSDYFEGIANLGNYIVTILDVKKVLNKPSRGLPARALVYAGQQEQ